MQYLVCMAGLPVEVVNEIRSNSERFTAAKGNAPIVKPVREPYTLLGGMATAYLQDLAARISTLDPSAQVSVILVYVDYQNEETKSFVGRFCPFALASPIRPFYPNLAPKKRRRSELLLYVEEIYQKIVDLRQRAGVVRDVLSGQNFTPLLLPMRNFQSAILGAELNGAFANFAVVQNPRAFLCTVSNNILQHHPLKQMDRDRWFEDSRRLRFKSPGTNRHGMVRGVAAGHRPECLIAGRVRFGGPFDALFHYDCNYKRRGLNASYPNCHDAQCAPASQTHVNIAPNDAVR